MWMRKEFSAGLGWYQTAPDCRPHYTQNRLKYNALPADIGRDAHPPVCQDDDHLV
jgi:hypothetical protein